MGRVIDHTQILFGIGATVVALAATSSVATAAQPVPCAAADGGRYVCKFYPAGNGITGGSPVMAPDGSRVGYLRRGANWVLCQRVGGSARVGSYFNNNWAYTQADNGRYGWVNAVYGDGGENDGPFGGVPAGCPASAGTPPAGASGAPTQPPAGPPATPGGGFNPDPTGFGGATVAAKKTNFFTKVAPLAAAVRGEFGVPVSFLMAQGAQESSYGTRTFNVKNFFGIKCPIGEARIASGCTSAGTTEVEGGRRVPTRANFRIYRSALDSFRDAGSLLKRRYARAFAFRTDPNAFARQVQKGGYATDPQYADNVIRVMQINNLYQYDR